MAEAALVLFDDLQARRWEPFALTRPAGELRFGAMRLVERAERTLGLKCDGYLTSPHLADFPEHGSPPVLSTETLPTDRHVVYWCSRAAAELAQKIPTDQGPAVYTLNDRPVGCFTPAGEQPDPRFLEDLVLEDEARVQVPVKGRLLEWIWELMLETPAWLRLDVAALHEDAVTAQLPSGVHALGDHPLILGSDVSLEPGTLFDLRDGPIYLADGVEVRSGTRVAGPSWFGRHSRLLGGSFEAISTGPYSYMHGELAHTVVLGYSNKAHDGYIGHAYIGKWVNLGALTTNSDLKNNYHHVRVWTPTGVQNTHALKVGCFLGDHVKTGIGLMLNSGTVIGAGANIYGSLMPPKYVQSFSWGEGDALQKYRLSDFLDTASVLMARRGVELDESGRRYLESCWRERRGGGGGAEERRGGRNEL